MKTSDRTSRKGLAALEFSLVLPVLALILFGIFEFGTAYYRQQVLTGAVREGARMGIVSTQPRPSDSQIRTKVLAYLQNVGWDTSQAVVSVTGAQGASGTPLTVRATYPTSLSVISKLTASAIHVDANGNVVLSANIVMELE